MLHTKYDRVTIDSLDELSMLTYDEFELIIAKSDHVHRAFGNVGKFKADQLGDRVLATYKTQETNPAAWPMSMYHRMTVGTEAEATVVAPAHEQTNHSQTFHIAAGHRSRT